MRLAIESKAAAHRGAPGLALAGWAASLVAPGLLLAAVASLAGLHVVRVTSGSMAPTIEVGDLLLVQDRHRQPFADLRRGDIVVFSFPLGSEHRAIKRVAGLPGDRLVVRDHWLWIDGRMVRLMETPGVGGVLPPPETVPVGTVFLLGDNVDASIDSRHFGPAPASEIYGRVLLHARRWTVWLGFLTLAVIAALTLGLGRRTPRQEAMTAP